QTQLETELIAFDSLPMEQILEEINQESNNLYAEAVGKLLAKKLNSETPIEAIKSSLDTIGINPDEYVLIDVSGLSRQNLITPQALIAILRTMSQLPEGISYRQTLALAGTNGTLKNRFVNSPVADNLWAKTGTLTGVGSLSGYLINGQDTDLVLSILVNNSELKSNKIRQAIDQIIVILNQYSKC
ncbi:MAG: D-alanyl-D-alanine carboxypeptidase/D-alanyl-D-alanine-endopeptidase, partial [Cyanobacteria bacterium P01_A01_bin.83]